MFPSVFHSPSVFQCLCHRWQFQSISPLCTTFSHHKLTSLPASRSALELLYLFLARAFLCMPIFHLVVSMPPMFFRHLSQISAYRWSMLLALVFACNSIRSIQLKRRLLPWRVLEITPFPLLPLRQQACQRQRHRWRSNCVSPGQPCVFLTALLRSSRHD